MSRPLAIAYVDGFNFYYGAVKDHPEFKWINFGALCDSLMTRSEVIAVRYYTARVEDRPDDPYQSQRQDVYLRASPLCPESRWCSASSGQTPRSSALLGEGGSSPRW